MSLALPFIGRRKEAAQLQRLHAQRKHVLILGPAGVGKTELIAHLHESLGLRLCPVSERLGEICDSLEHELELESAELHLTQRKNRLLNCLKGTKGAIVFDGVCWTTPKLASFIEGVSERVPVWICARSEHPWDIGHVWPLLVRFEQMELKPFHPGETQMLVEAAVHSGSVSADTLKIVAWLHRRAAGNPKVLWGLLEEIASGHYHLSNTHALRLLGLDHRIHEIFPEDRKRAI